MFEIPKAITAYILFKLIEKTGSKEISKALGKQYALLDEDDFKCFDKLWDQYDDARKFKKKHKDEIQAEVDRAYRWLASLARLENYQRQPDNNIPAGHRLAHWADYNRRYVIFSDHHFMHQHEDRLHVRHRHDINTRFPVRRDNGGFEYRLGNRYLYSDILNRYNNSGYTLVENGDVEDLVIFEPTVEDTKERKKMNARQLEEHKTEYRHRQLEDILATYNDLYTQIQTTFHHDGRYVRLAGNHDQDMQRDAFTHTLRNYYHGINVYDYLMLYNPNAMRNNDVPRYIVGHGHQFDVNCTPKYAPQQGEIFSESLAWAFQGADRIWRWNDGPRRWAVNFPFNNKLVRGDKQFCKELFKGNLDGFDDLVESIFGCEIAWEYFENESALNALIEEVFKGEEFFKYRHLDEVELCKKYKEAFSNAPDIPTLILGHSHEPRLNALNEKNRPERHYANCGTEGRFENLIWCIEVEGDDMRVVSWHYERLLRGIPDSNTRLRPPVRTVYQSNGDVLVQNRVEELPE